MATAEKTPRLLAAAKEFNIGKETLIEFLIEKKFDINASNPNVKLTPEMYAALQREFAQDKAAKRKSEEIALPKGALLDNIDKTKEELDITIRDKHEEKPVEAKPEPKKAAAPKVEPKPVVEPEAPKPAPAAPVEVPAPVAEEKPVEAEKKPAEEKPAPEPVAEKEKKGAKLGVPNVI
ncbi:MAG: hypothetical protein K8F30_01435, partial [Taibaiella sp.]|nr:hypothetical protein [Taibaiella sp.]